MPMKPTPAEQCRQYPMAPEGEWYGEGTYKEQGGILRHVAPDEYLAKVRPLTMDDESRENIDLLKAHIEAGKTLDPLLIRASGVEDGRHRATAAKELGIPTVPVIDYGGHFQGSNNPSNHLLAQSEMAQAAIEMTATSPPEFKAWFGASKVVDADGHALPVYRGHQTGTGRNAFTFYSDKSAVANTYANKFGDVACEVRHRSGDVARCATRAEAQAYKKGNGGTIVNVNNEPTLSKDFLSMQNPLVVDAQGAQWNMLRNPFAKLPDVAAHAKAIAAAKRDLKLNGRLYSIDAQRDDIDREHYFKVFADTNRLAELAKAAGHDGLIVKNVYDVGITMDAHEALKSTVYAAFQPEQIRSALSNGGHLYVKPDHRSGPDENDEQPLLEAPCP